MYEKIFLIIERIMCDNVRTIVCLSLLYFCGDNYFKYKNMPYVYVRIIVLAQILVYFN